MIEKRREMMEEWTQFLNIQTDDKKSQ